MAAYATPDAQVVGKALVYLTRSYLHHDGSKPVLSTIFMESLYPGHKSVWHPYARLLTVAPFRLEIMGNTEHDRKQRSPHT